jgi:hypothetical protein
MPNYRRYNVPGHPVFLTVVTHERRPWLADRGTCCSDLVGTIKRDATWRLKRTRLAGPLWQNRSYDHVIRDEEESGPASRLRSLQPGQAGSSTGTPRVLPSTDGRPSRSQTGSESSISSRSASPCRHLHSMPRQRRQRVAAERISLAACLMAAETPRRTRESHIIMTEAGVLRPVIIPMCRRGRAGIIKSNMETAGMYRQRYFELLQAIRRRSQLG